MNNFTTRTRDSRLWGGQGKFRFDLHNWSRHRARKIFWCHSFESPMFVHPSVTSYKLQLTSYKREGDPFLWVPISIQSEDRGKDGLLQPCSADCTWQWHIHRPAGQDLEITEYSFGGWVKSLKCCHCCWGIDPIGCALGANSGIRREGGRLIKDHVGPGRLLGSRECSLLSAP